MLPCSLNSSHGPSIGVIHVNGVSHRVCRRCKEDFRLDREDFLHERLPHQDMPDQWQDWQIITGLILLTVAIGTGVLWWIKSY